MAGDEFARPWFCAVTYTHAGASLSASARAAEKRPGPRPWWMSSLLLGASLLVAFLVARDAPKAAH